VRILDREVTKAEVLSRWFDEHLGQVSPARFIPLAENSNLIGQLGAQVLEDVLETLREVQKMGREVQISLNVSPVEFMSENFSEDKAQSFAKFPEVEKASIVFELTEGIFLNKKELIEERITEFHDQGIKFAIDDFGTGYSSLAYLQQLDVDFIKIDKAFIDKIETAEGLALCKAIVDLSHALGLQLIAEGVETETQLHLLEQIGCEYAQGYFFSKPVPKGDFLRLLG
jgi:EAL domain-containing protein (putative c-di-GMP-specific phosphodiesterase class I)